MPRLSKFDLMRNNREVAACRNYHELAIAAAAAAPGQVVPTMTFGGAKYREAPETNVCEGCDLRDQGGECCLPGGWHDDNVLTVRAFGGGCMNRQVVYVRAEG